MAEKERPWLLEAAQGHGSDGNHTDADTNRRTGTAVQRTTASRRPRQSRPAPGAFLALLPDLTQRIEQLGLSLQNVDDLAGTNDGHVGHILSPNSKNGRVPTFYTLDLIVSALWPNGYEIRITDPDPVSALTVPPHLRAKAATSWRLPKYFREIGRLGGKATAQRHGKEFVRERGRKGWRARKARRGNQQ